MKWVPQGRWILMGLWLWTPPLCTQLPTQIEMPVLHHIIDRLSNVIICIYYVMTSFMIMSLLFTCTELWRANIPCPLPVPCPSQVHDLVNYYYFFGKKLLEILTTQQIIILVPHLISVVSKQNCGHSVVILWTVCFCFVLLYHATVFYMH